MQDSEAGRESRQGVEETNPEVNSVQAGAEALGQKMTPAPYVDKHAPSPAEQIVAGAKNETRHVLLARIPFFTDLLRFALRYSAAILSLSAKSSRERRTSRLEMETRSRKWRVFIREYNDISARTSGMFLDEAYSRAAVYSNGSRT